MQREKKFRAEFWSLLADSKNLKAVGCNLVHWELKKSLE